MISAGVRGILGCTGAEPGAAVLDTQGAQPVQQREHSHMSDPNSALSAWQLAIMAVVIVASLSAWLIAVYLADR